MGEEVCGNTQSAWVSRMQGGEVSRVLGPVLHPLGLSENANAHCNRCPNACQQDRQHGVGGEQPCQTGETAHSLSSWLAPMRARFVLHTGQDGTARRLCAESTTMSRQNLQKSCPHLETTGSTIRSV